ncbi:Rossmann-like and DUF2520 domain-containing protein [Flagellimonas sp.]|uniref:Rossmann-like and DUF2520 domain-containing protein n=1 Tax=Flagellimonas sp. TaxID=2058762 RepID=UPI003B50F60D
MYSVVLLGTGNLAQHLFEAFLPVKEIQIVQVYGRNPEKLIRFQQHTNVCSDPMEIVDADIYIIAVKDDAITAVAALLTSKKGIVAHTSGAVDMDAIALKNRGVFYPLQTFTKGKSLNFGHIPICIEAEQAASVQMLKQLGGHISAKVVEITSEQRKKLHLSAVFVNNFTNHLYQIGADICEKEGLSFELLHPLILETAEKIQDISPFDAQTGPARRGDTESIKNHLGLLNDQKHVELYTLFSTAIKKAYEKKL